MMTIKNATLVILVLAGLGIAQEPPGLDAIPAQEAASADWVVKSEDNVCGVSEARQITFPAKVRYDELMRATPEMKEIKRLGIDKDSARGQALITDARSRILNAARAVMTDKGHCSVWKKITSTQGQSVTDITDAVLQKMQEDEPPA